MPFFASRQAASQINGADPSPIPPEAAPGLTLTGPPPAPAGMPAFLENALQRVAASVLPQLEPVVRQAEAVIGEFRATLGELKASNAALRAELSEVRAQLARQSSHDDRVQPD